MSRHHLTARTAWLLATLLVLALTRSAWSEPASAQQADGATGGVGPPPLPLISEGLPAFASSARYPASEANDGDYRTVWRSAGTPAWLAYDLSSVPATRRQQVAVAWYNDPETGSFDHTLVGEYPYNLLRAYTLEANRAPGGTNPPAGGWVVLATVADNRYHSRQHVLDLTGYTWLRLVATAIDGAAENFDAALNLDVHDASQGIQDDWIFYGDSITAAAMSHDPFTESGGKGVFAQLIHARLPDRFPIQESGGIGGLTSSEGARYLSSWLSLFPGRFVVLGYGTNDASGAVPLDPSDVDGFYANYARMVDAVISAGKVPIIPSIPWGRTAGLQTNGPTLNGQLEQLEAAYPQVLPGPDFWSYFQQHPELISEDGIHPNAGGMVSYRTLWADWALATVYGSPPQATSTRPTPGPRTTSTQGTATPSDQPGGADPDAVDATDDSPPEGIEP